MLSIAPFSCKEERKSLLKQHLTILHSFAMVAHFK
nr:MAG TPA: hypothetical protein [Caudoviricetes sp.]